MLADLRLVRIAVFLVSLDYLAPYGQIQLRRRCEIGADQVYVAQFHSSVFALGVQEVQQRGATVLVGKQHSVAHANGLFQVLRLVGF